jgi:hypothetical protein
MVQHQFTNYTNMVLSIMRKLFLAVLLALLPMVAEAAIGIDPATPVENNAVSNSLVLTYSTTNTNDIICVAITSNGGPVTGVSSVALGALTPINSTFVSGTPAQSMDLYCKFSAAAQTGDSITVSTTSSAFVEAIVWGISGAASSNFVDTTTLTSVNSAAHMSINTNSSPTHEFIIAVYRTGFTNPTAGAGWSQVTLSGLFTLVEYQIVSTAQVGLSATIGAGDTTQNAGVAAGICEAGITCNVVAGGRNGSMGLMGIGQ